jgi:WD40 repeat protein
VGLLCLAASRDGRTLAAGGLGGPVWVWDLKTRRVGPPLFVTSTSRTVWNKWALTAGLGAPLVYPEFREYVSSVALSTDGRLLAAASHRRAVKLWDLPSGRERARLQLKSGSWPALALSPDDSLLAVSDGTQVYLHDTADGQLRQALPPSRDPIHCLSFSPDGRLLALGGEGREITVWDLPAGRERASLIGHGDRVSSLAFTPDGRTLASASWDKTVRLWHVSTGQELAILDGHNGGVHAVAFSPDGKTLVSGGDRAEQGKVLLWQAGP